MIGATADPMVASILDGGEPSVAEFLEAWGETFPLLRELEKTPQDPEWHGEGNVLIHTEMVLERLYEELADCDLVSGPEVRLALVIAALFHDLGKPLTTRTVEIGGRERIVAPRHADRGRSYLAYRLMGLGLRYDVVRRVLAIVGHHHDPKWLVIKDRPGSSYRRLARLAPTQSLYVLERADLRGRVCPDLDEQLDQIEYFRLAAEEHGAWGTREPYALWSEPIREAVRELRNPLPDLVWASAIRDAEAGVIYTPEEAIARSYRYRDGFAQLVVMCGPSGSGKSRWVERHLPGFEVISLDEIRREITGDAASQKARGRVRQLAKERLRAALQHHRPVVWDATSLRRDFRRAVIDLGYAYGALTTLVVCHVTQESSSRRNRERSRSVPEGVLQSQFDQTEWPYEDEAHRTAFIDEHGELLHANFAGPLTTS